VNPWFVVTDPENIAGPIFVNVDEPETKKDPDTTKDEVVA
jgi:hypothetical protein